MALVPATAFTVRVKAFADSLIMPLPAAITGDVGVRGVVLTPNGAEVTDRSLLGAVIAFLLIAPVLVLVVKGPSGQWVGRRR